MHLHVPECWLLFEDDPQADNCVAHVFVPRFFAEACKRLNTIYEAKSIKLEWRFQPPAQQTTNTVPDLALWVTRTQEEVMVGEGKVRRGYLTACTALQPTCVPACVAQPVMRRSYLRLPSPALALPPTLLTRPPILTPPSCV